MQIRQILLYSRVDDLKKWLFSCCTEQIDAIYYNGLKLSVFYLDGSGTGFFRSIPGKILIKDRIRIRLFLGVGSGKSKPGSATNAVLLLLATNTAWSLKYIITAVDEDGRDRSRVGGRAGGAEQGGSLLGERHGGDGKALDSQSGDSMYIFYNIAQCPVPTYSW